MAEKKKKRKKIWKKFRKFFSEKIFPKIFFPEKWFPKKISEKVGPKGPTVCSPPQELEKAAVVFKEEGKFKKLQKHVTSMP